jgi:hypothetical protein
MKKLALAVAILLFSGCNTDPGFEGRPLSVWRTELKSRDAMARLHAVTAFSMTAGKRPGVGRDAIPDLTACLSDQSHYVRAEACVALGRMGPDAKEAVPKLIELLKDKGPGVSALAGKALWKIDPDAAQEAGA